MEIDWTIPISIVVGSFTLLLAAGATSATTLYIHWRKRKDARIKQVKDRADAHRTVWYTLLQIQADEERKSVEADMFKDARHVPNVSTNQQLQDYFRDNAMLLAPDLHDAYQRALGNDVAIRAHYKSDFGEDMDMPGMIRIAKKEMDVYEQKYKDMGGFDPRKK